MDDSYLALRRLFLRIATTGLAATTGACDELDSDYPIDAFETEVCPSGTSAWVHDVTRDPAVDAIFLRENRFTDPSGDPSAPDVVVGTLCDGATDAAACLEAIATLPEYPTFFASFDLPGVQIGWTRGDEVGLVVSGADLRMLFGSIDTPSEAYTTAILGTNGAWDVCYRPNVRAIADGFEVLVAVGSSCGGTQDLEHRIVRVAADGSLKTVGRRVIARADPNCAIGRLTEGVAIAGGRAATIGEHFARMAALEAAAVIAFERLADELHALGAPAELVSRARRSARDEARHVAMVDALRVRFGAASVAIDQAPHAARSRVTIALENATEGMVRETYGALAATYHAAHATDAEVARLFRSLAIDETRHAALARDVGTWIEATLSDDERLAVERARRQAVATLADDIAVDLGDEVHSAMGWPRPEVARGLIAAAFPAVWA